MEVGAYAVSDPRIRNGGGSRVRESVARAARRLRRHGCDWRATVNTASTTVDLHRRPAQTQTQTHRQTDRETDRGVEGSACTLVCQWHAYAHAVAVHAACQMYSHTHTHTHTHPFNGPFSGTTRVSRYQKGKTNLDFTEATDSEWQWHQLGHMQVCTSLQTDNHMPARFFTGRMPFHRLHPALLYSVSVERKN